MSVLLWPAQEAAAETTRWSWARVGTTATATPPRPRSACSVAGRDVCICVWSCVRVCVLALLCVSVCVCITTVCGCVDRLTLPTVDFQPRLTCAPQSHHSTNVLWFVCDTPGWQRRRTHCSRRGASLPTRRKLVRTEFVPLLGWCGLASLVWCCVCRRVVTPRLCLGLFVSLLMLLSPQPWTSPRSWIATGRR